MSIQPCWAPSYFNGLEGMITEPMKWEDRGIRGELYAVKVAKVSKTYRHSGKFVFNLEVDCTGDRKMQCTLAPNEDEAVAKAFEAVTGKGLGYVISPTPSTASLNAEFATVALLVEEQPVYAHDGFEVVVHCAANLMTRSQHSEDKKTVLIRHDGASLGAIAGQLRYLWSSNKVGNLPATLPRQDGESELDAAVRGGKISEVKELLGREESLATFDIGGRAPLHTAAARGYIDILRLLLSHKLDIEIQDRQPNKDTPLAHAAESGQANSIRLLLEYGANVHARNSSDYTPVMIAASQRHPGAVKALLEDGANPNDKASDGKTPLLLASRAGRYRLPTLQALVEGGADVNFFPTGGRSPLHSIAQFGEPEEMAYLLENGSDPDSVEYTSWTSLILAIRESKRECVRLLLDAGANRNTIDKEHRTPAHFAADCSNWQIMEMLLEEDDVGLDVQTASEGWTPLHIALEKKQTMVAKILLKAGASVEVMDAEGKTPLDYNTTGLLH